MKHERIQSIEHNNLASKLNTLQKQSLLNTAQSISKFKTNPVFVAKSSFNRYKQIEAADALGDQGSSKV